jgi:prepilin-type N-terminal cleavage/methylation domain-containing protein
VAQDFGMRNCSGRRNFDHHRRAFTLVELVVVIAVIAMLALLCLPAMGKGRSRSQDMGCLNNMRQMSVAWRMYAGDNADRLVSNPGGTNVVGWVAGVMSWSLNSGNTNSALLTQGLLGSYTAQNVEIYHCPADPSAVAGQLRVRSISMNACVGQRLDLSGGNTYGVPYKQLLKGSDFSNPSRVFVFLDEHPDSLNDGLFALLVSTGFTNEWGDLPAAHHNGAGSFSFGDGHAEFHKWVESTTLKPIQKSSSGLPLAAPNSRDLAWAIQGLPQ